MYDIEYFKSIQSNSETSSTSGEASLFSRNLIIFDFDDTIFCTKYFDTFSLPYKDIFSNKMTLGDINPDLIKELNQLENTIIDSFSNLKQSCDIVIITNAGMKWIDNCLTFFLEELKEYISENNIKIYSAKDMYNKLVKNKNLWKIKCFKKVINDLYKHDLSYNDLNVISIGDGNEEKKAVFSLTKVDKFHRINPKFIHTISFPTSKSIILQMKYLNNNLTNMIYDNSSIFKLGINFINNKAEINCKSVNSKKNKCEDTNSIDYLIKNDLDEKIVSFNKSI